MTVLTMKGREINWDRPLLPWARVMWSEKTRGGAPVTGSLRTIAHIDRLDSLAKARGWKSGLEIIQPPYNTSVEASAGTHDFDACFDWWIPDCPSWWTMQRFGRANGAGGWYRHGPLFSNHQHSFTLPPRDGQMVSDNFLTAGFEVGKYVDGGWSTEGRRITSSQLEDYYVRAFGLSGMHTPGSDKSWFPPNINKTIFDLDAYIARRAA